jgi:hypothetical protein
MDNPFSIDAKILDELYLSYTEAMDGVRYDARPEEEESIPGPIGKAQLKMFIEIAFWASLTHEEGRFHEFSLIMLPKEGPNFPFAFASPIHFDEHNLAKLAPALDQLSNSIGVWPGEDGRLYIWGFAPLDDTGLHGVSLTASTLAPGQIIVSFTQYGILHFSSLITGTRAEFVARSEFLTWVVPEIKKSTDRIKLDALFPAIDYRTIALAMRAHKHGGTLLLVKNESDWLESIRQPMKFSGPPYRRIEYDVGRRTEIRRQEKETGSIMWRESPRIKMAMEAANKALRSIGRLTAVDGATVISYKLEVFAFGAKIHAKSENEKPDTVLISEPFKDSQRSEIGLSELGGTRHQSAVQFVFDQKDAIAFVASQDGRLSVMRWDPEAKKVLVIRPAEFALL